MLQRLHQFEFVREPQRGGEGEQRPRLVGRGDRRGHVEQQGGHAQADLHPRQARQDESCLVGAAGQRQAPRLVRQVRQEA